MSPSRTTQISIRQRENCHQNFRSHAIAAARPVIFARRAFFVIAGPELQVCGSAAIPADLLSEAAKITANMLDLKEIRKFFAIRVRFPAAAAIAGLNFCSRE